MTKDIVKGSKIVKDATANVRSVLDAMERAKDIYIATMKRAEAEFAERMKRISSVLEGDEEPIITPAPKSDPSQPTTSPN